MSLNSSVEGVNEDAFKKWLVSLDPAHGETMLLRLSQGAIADLKVLYAISQHADDNCEQAVVAFERIESEEKALYEKKNKLLAQFGLDCSDLSSDVKINQNSLTICDLIMNNPLGDGSDLGAAISLSDVTLQRSQEIQQKILLKSDVNAIKQKCNSLIEANEFFESQCKVFTEEARRLELSLKDSSVQNCVFKVETNKVEQLNNLAKAKLDELGIDSSISESSILNYHKDLLEILSQITEAQDRIKEKYADFPPSISEALCKLKETKQELSDVSERFRQKLMFMGK